MSLRNSSFGWKSVWMTLAEDAGGDLDDHVDAAGWLKVQIQLNKSAWTLTYKVLHAHKHNQKTTVVMPFNADRDFSFCVRNRSWLGDTMKLFGMQDIEIGDNDFDRDYYIQGSDELLVNRLLQSQKLKELIDGQGSLNFDIRRTQHAEDEIPAGTTVLYFEDHTTINSYERLRAIHDLMAAALEELQTMGIASHTAPTTPEVVKIPGSVDAMPTAAQRISTRLRT
ncbi:MAG TPA: hypothetical protein V6C69_18555 [Trichormus sp.]